MDEILVGSLLKKASSTALGVDRINAGILKVFWKWKQQLFVGLVSACIWVGFYLEL